MMPKRSLNATGVGLSSMIVRSIVAMWHVNMPLRLELRHSFATQLLELKIRGLKILLVFSESSQEVEVSQMPADVLQVSRQSAFENALWDSLR